MKKALLIIVVTIISLCSAHLYSAEPLVKFYLMDGSPKQYNLSEIENMKFSSAPDTLQLHIFKNDGKSLYYPAQLIDSIKFAVDTTNENRLHLWHDGFIWDIAIHEIDSILLYYTTYTAVTIGEQHWMYKNLNVDHYRNGDSIPEVRDSLVWRSLNTGAWCNYNHDSALGAVYGKLYNWYAVNDPRGLAPIVWNIPSDEEWTVLHIGLWGYTVAGGRLKSTGSKEAGDGLWYSPNKGATNESGFSAIPGGGRDFKGSFNDIGYHGNWWESWNGYIYYRPWHRYLDYNNTIIYSIEGTDGSGFSVRCIKD